MRNLGLLIACANEPWAIEQSKLRSVTQFLIARAGGAPIDLEAPRAAREELQRLWLQGGGLYVEDEDLSELPNDISRPPIEARITPGKERKVREAPGTIGVLNVFGVISQRMNMMEEFSGGTSTEQLVTAFRNLQNDDRVKAIVLNIDSPGGTVPGIQEFAQEIFESRGVKPVVAQVNSMAASAAYWIASAADEVVVTPSGQVGSIGVYTIHEDISAFLEQMGVKETIIHSEDSPYKTEGNPYQPLSADALADIQARVNRVSDRFITAVADGRGVSVDTVKEKFGQGRMFDARDAVKRGLADTVATLEDTLERLGVEPRPVTRHKNSARSRDAAAFQSKLSREGEPPSVRETERGLRGFGVPRSVAEKVARLCHAKDEATTQGEPEPSNKSKGTDPVVAKQLREFGASLNSLTDAVKSLTKKP